MTFKEKYLAGEIRFEEIDDYIEIWNNSDDERTLAQFLGLGADEEDVWICLLYTSDAADDMQCVDLGGRRIIKKSFFQAEDGIRDRSVSRGLGDVYKRQIQCWL